MAPAPPPGRPSARAEPFGKSDTGTRTYPRRLIQSANVSCALAALTLRSCWHIIGPLSLAQRHVTLEVNWP